MTRAELLREVEVLANLESDTLTEGDSLEELPEWDSLAVLGVISLFEKKFGFVLKPAAIQGCRTIGEVIDLVDNRLDG